MVEPTATSTVPVKDRGDAAPSKVERAKAASRQLRGTVAETLRDGRSHFEHDDVQVLKFHGIYQQDDRDSRVERRHAGQEKARSFMVRARIPGGTLSAEQYLAFDTIAGRFAHNGSLRLTSRQSIQLHGVGIGDLRETIRQLDEALVSTLAACGDVMRNVMAAPGPIDDAGHRAVRAIARGLAAEMAPRSGAYHEIWLDGERVDLAPTNGDTKTLDTSNAVSEEPFYGETYLPRKLKVAVTLAADAGVDLYSQDVALLAILDGDDLLGVDVLAGGGLGMTHRKADTFARLATPLGFVRAPHAVEVVATIAAIFRDHGNRSDRRHARLKYLLEDWGLERFRSELQRRGDFELLPWVDPGPLHHDDHLGPRDQGDGLQYYGVWVPSGRIGDEDVPLRSALRRAVAELRPGRVILTPSQNLLLCDLEPAQVDRLESLLRAAGVPLPSELSPARRYSLACPALPTCGLALADAERAIGNVLGDLEHELEVLGLDDEPLTVRMTGCPNGCARPYTADIGLVGRGPNRYDVYLGGRLAGDRLGALYDEEVAPGAVVEALRPLLRAWSRNRLPEEGLGAFFRRLHGGELSTTLLTGAKEPLRAEIESRFEALSQPTDHDPWRLPVVATDGSLPAMQGER
jgi:sulfite reductase (ferredoxin)